MTFWLKFVLVLTSVTLTDICWTFYILRVGQHKALQAGAWGSLISLLSAFTVISYTEDKRFIIATVIGAFIGTITAIKLSKAKF